MLKRFFYAPSGKPYLWRRVAVGCVVWVIALTIGLSMLIESNAVGQLIQYLKVEIAK